MPGLLRASSRCLASYRDGRRLLDAYQLLITKKPVEYDYVAVDINSFFGGAQRLAKNVAPETRRNREVARHVVHAIQQLLRRIVCKHSLLLALDGAGTAATVYNFRHSPLTRRQDTRRLRLPGMSMTRTVEERVVKGMPFSRGLVPREVVVAGTNVAGSVERKVTAWALDLACRDGTQQHTTRSLCVIGSGTLWHTMLGLTPYFQGTHIMHGSTDLRHLTLSDTLTWLHLSAAVQSGDTYAVTTGRIDALLLTLLCNGYEVTELPALPGANFVVLMDAYHRRRCADSSTNAAAASSPAATGTTPHAHLNGASPTSPSFQLFREMPHNVLEVDLLALYLLFLPENEVATAVAELTSDVAAAAAPSSQPTPPAATSREPPRDASYLFFESFLSHVLSTHYLLCYGETTADALRVPFYLTNFTDSYTTTTFNREDRVVEGGKSEVTGDTTARKPRHVDADINRKTEVTLSVKMWVEFLKKCVLDGRRYHVVNCIPPPSSSAETPAPASRTPTMTMTETELTASVTSPNSRQPTEVASTEAISTTAAPPASSPSFYPFWTVHQPWTAAEYTLLCQTLPNQVESLLKEYLPSVAHTIQAEFVRYLTSQSLSVDEARRAVQRLFAHANVDAPHPSLCLSPSYYWAHNEKSRMWSMRYVDLGVQARRSDIRHARSLLSGMNMSQQQSEEGAIIFDAEAQAWALQPTFPLPTHDTATVSTKVDLEKEGEGGKKKGSFTAVLPAGAAPTLKVLTWNVMFDRYSNQPTPLGMPGIDWCSPKRYPVLAKIIADENADVVGMQEVELAFAEYLAAQPWCRERYIMSCRPRSPILDPWGVLLLVRRGEDAWPVQQLMHLNVPAWSGHVSLMPVVTLDLSSKGRRRDGGDARLSTSSAAARTSRQVSVCAMHLLAPYLKAHETARTGQDQALRHCLTRQLHGDTIVMGDFNDWPSNEFIMPAETRYVECWPMVRPGDYGKTMDESNTFCKLKIEEIFFGRSDKLFLRTGGGSSNAPPLLKPAEAHLVGTRSVNAENGNQDAPAYLFPSDHYGVSMTFQVLQLGSQA
ncbi:putative mitochondrial Rna-editing complex protein MP100 [Leptomonas pyrrhocoris]|uniref:Putative mitochondrial Rna-editing complex protein MP100 n=1 Tax=Leptomonas pyrrhocoris TaxID=157538 RepID=A0A0N0VI66_LEPPY|nr:putative mitochondrial Rna-editing complex protein MP100 [Leptomonas pyrrhocoris]KPA86824.1 putative mitochondrial Rna-editing complex protein MP100 [Leptomonas pyrrhocoris]|eukprot:XP_015665263.1 putative mitochondrial Rna-editing complex protein MP100 [Leptomonas pyrrhocoris]